MVGRMQVANVTELVLCQAGRSKCLTSVHWSVRPSIHPSFTTALGVALMTGEDTAQAQSAWGEPKWGPQILALTLSAGDLESQRVAPGHTAEQGGALIPCLSAPGVLGSLTTWVLRGQLC